MNGNMFAWYLKEHLLKAKQTFAHVNDLPKKHATRDKTKPLSSQRVGPMNEQPTIKGFLSRTHKTTRTKAKGKV
jgi:hypothetical protein